MTDIAPADRLIFHYEEPKKFFLLVNERYRVFRLDEWDRSPGVILRHDVDLSIKAACGLGSLKKNCGTPEAPSTRT